MTEPELDDAFDELFVGASPPATPAEALARLPADVQERINADPEALKTLADLVWMSNALQSHPPMPTEGFARRATDAAYRVGEFAPKSNWNSLAGIAVAAAVLLAVGIIMWRPAGDQAKGPILASNDVKTSGDSPAFALFDQVKRLTPSFSGEPAVLASLGRSDIASIAVRRETGPLAKTISAPAENFAVVGKKIEQEVRPLRDSVRDAFAFLGEFPVKEKKSL